jgi:tRNA (guanosine-2'-O-)-methyltransferase
MDKETKSKEHVLEQFLQPERLHRLDEVLSSRTNTLTVVLDQVRNSHNVSAVLRSADAFGVSTVHLVGEEFTYSPSISQGTERWMQLRSHPNAQAAISALRESGFSIVVLRPEEQSTGDTRPVLPVSQLPFEEKLALVFGNEASGVDPAFSDAADISSFIPMAGFVESLNISVACAICLYSSTISGASPGRRTPPLSNDERTELRDLWLKKGVKNSDIILREIQIRDQDQESVP